MSESLVAVTRAPRRARGRHHLKVAVALLTALVVLVGLALAVYAGVRELSARHVAAAAGTTTIVAAVVLAAARLV